MAYTSSQVVQAVPVPAGIIQVKSTTLTTTFSGVATLGTFLAVTGLTVAITPTSTNNKILVMASLSLDNSPTTSGGISAILTGGNCASYRATADGTRQTASVVQSKGSSSRVPANVALLYLDSPATTSSITYGVSLNYVADSSATNTVYLNRAALSDDNTYTGLGSSTITVMEILP